MTIDFDREVWRIPETKNGEPQSICLVPRATELLKQRKVKAQSQWVFENEDGTDHFKDPKKAWDRVRQRGTVELWSSDPKLKKLIKEVEVKLEQADNYDVLFEGAE